MLALRSSPRECQTDAEGSGAMRVYLFGGYVDLTYQQACRLLPLEVPAQGLHISVYETFAASWRPQGFLRPTGSRFSKLSLPQPLALGACGRVVCSESAESSAFSSLYPYPLLTGGLVLETYHDSPQQLRSLSGRLRGAPRQPVWRPLAAHAPCSPCISRMQACGVTICLATAWKTQRLTSNGPLFSQVRR